MTITDEIVEKAKAVFWQSVGDDGWTNAAITAAILNVLKSAAPALIAQGMREAAEISANEEVHWIAEEILERAQEIDPQ